MADEDAKVVVLAEVGPSLRPKRKKVLPGRAACRCWRVVVDTHTRMLECQDCGATIEPFEYLLKCAEYEQSLFATVGALRIERDELNKERALLKDEITGLKAKLPRLIRSTRA